LGDSVELAMDSLMEIWSEGTDYESYFAVFYRSPSVHWGFLMAV